jgi:hypothetical protein
MTAAEAAAQKAAQVAEAEAEGRRPENGEEGEHQIPAVIDDAAPEPTPAPAPEESEPKPAAEPPLSEDPRKAIARRFKARRDAQNETLVDTSDPAAVPFLNPKPEETPPDEEPVVETPPPAEPEKLTIKVNGKESAHSRDELLAMAGLSAEDADGLPAASLIKAAQINEAARIKFERTKDLGAPPAPAAPAATPAAQEEPPAEPASRKRRVAIPADALKDAIEKVQLGDAEEASNAFVDAIETVIDARHTSEREDAARADNQKAIEQFSEANPDITTDNRASRVLLSETTAAIIDDLRSLGAHEANLQPLLLNPQMAIEAHRQARVAGMKVRQPAEILSAAGNETRTILGMKKPGEAPPPPPTPPAPSGNTRQEAKQRLSQQPLRAGSPVPPAPPAQQPANRYSGVVQKMRQMRGQGQVA